MTREAVAATLFLELMGLVFQDANGRRFISACPGERGCFKQISLDHPEHIFLTILPLYLGGFTRQSPQMNDLWHITL